MEIKNQPSKEIFETTTNYMNGDQFFTMFSSEYIWIRRLEKWANEYPNDVIITHRNEDGSLEAEVRKTWFRIGPPITRNLSEEQRKAASERMKAIQEAKKQKNS